jgi:hypothetical protein
MIISEKPLTVIKQGVWGEAGVNESATRSYTINELDLQPLATGIIHFAFLFVYFVPFLYFMIKKGLLLRYTRYICRL